MATDDVREQAKAEIRRQVWGSQRGIATRAFIREHSEVVQEFNDTGTITNAGLSACSECGGTGQGSTLEPDKDCGVCAGTGKVVLTEFPQHVTRASVLLELNMRARRREQSTEAKRWAVEHPREVEEMRAQIQQEMSDAKES